MLSELANASIWREILAARIALILACVSLTIVTIGTAGLHSVNAN